MNPVLIILVVLYCIILWFVLYPTFMPIGRFLNEIWDNVKDIINKKDNEEGEKEEWEKEN